MDKISGLRIKECRKEAKMTQDELGKRLGVKKSAVSKWETGKIVNLKRDTIQSMANMFDVSPMWLMGYDVAKEINLEDADPFIDLQKSIELLAEKYNTFSDIPPEKLEALNVVAQEAVLLRLHQIFLLR